MKLQFKPLNARGPKILSIKTLFERLWSFNIHKSNDVTCDKATSRATVFALKSVKTCHYQDQLAMKLQCKLLSAGCLNSFKIFKKICNPILYYYTLYETKVTGRALVNL